MSTEIPVDREQLEADANKLRERLADNLETLDQRVHDTLNVKKQVTDIKEEVVEQVTKHPMAGVLIGAGSLLAVAGGIGVVAYRSRHKKLQHTELPILGPQGPDGWQHPQRVAPPPSGGLTKELVGRVVVSVAAFVISQLAKQALLKHVPKLRLKVEPVSPESPAADPGVRVFNHSDEPNPE